MNYLLFNGTVLLKGEKKAVRTIGKGPIADHALLGIESARVCVVDIDLVVAAAVEHPVEKKDSILVRKFKELYQHEPYIIQDERIDTNLFQVIGIKEAKVREVYSHVPSQKVDAFIPYGMAVRNALTARGISLNRSVVFLDDIGKELLLTVFYGMMFSRTRVIASDDENIIPEIKRSQIDFFKKNEEFLNKKNTEFVILTNNKNLAAQISKNNENFEVEYLNLEYPAFEGLKEDQGQFKYLLPEEILKARREIELRNNIKASIFSMVLVGLGIFYFLFNKIEQGLVNSEYSMAQHKEERLDMKLLQTDRLAYRDELDKQKNLNFGVVYAGLLEIIPPSYDIDSFKFYKKGRWMLDMSLLSDDAQSYDPIPKVLLLKSAQIKDVFDNDKPGKHLRITL